MKQNKRSHTEVNFVKTKMNFNELKALDEMCNKPENYFDFEMNPIMGKGNQGPRFTNDIPIQHSVVCYNKYDEAYQVHRRLGEVGHLPSVTRKPYKNEDSNLLKLINRNNSTSINCKNQNHQIINKSQLETIYNDIKTHLSQNSFEVTLHYDYIKR